MTDFRRVKMNTNKPSTTQLIQNVRKSALRRRGFRFCFRAFVNSCSHRLQVKIEKFTKLTHDVQTQNKTASTNFMLISSIVPCLQQHRKRCDKIPVCIIFQSINNIEKEIFIPRFSDLKLIEIKLRLQAPTISCSILVLLSTNKITAVELRVDLFKEIKGNERICLIYACRIVLKYT